jgi:hypothetical protein
VRDREAGGGDGGVEGREIKVVATNELTIQKK